MKKIEDIPDKLYCKKTLVHNEKIYLIHGNYYKVNILSYNSFSVDCEDKDEIYFNINGNNKYSWYNYLCTIKDLRKLKLINVL